MNLRGEAVSPALLSLLSELMHAISTFSSYKQYMDPWNNLFFFAAWPMLAACVALYLLREKDTLLSVDALRRGKQANPN